MGSSGLGGGTSGSAGTSAGFAGIAGTAGSGGTTAGSANENGGSGGEGGSVPASVTFSVTTQSGLRAISPLIYGVNPGALECADASARFALCRLGGNRWSTYNWENNASNAGSDLCFQNDGALEASDTPGLAVTRVMQEAAGVSAATLVTVPVLDYVARDKLGGTPPPDCSGNVTESGADYLTTRFAANFATKGSGFVNPPNTTDDAVYADEFVAFLQGSAGQARVIFGLDNQPGLWSLTHSEIHPDPATYAEVVQRNEDFARAIRATWPTTEISGYVGYGYNDFINLQNSPDAATLGTFVDYYLDAMQSADDGTPGARLVDYLDVHWYSEAQGDQGRIITNDASPSMVSARVQAPRSLFDASYVENSWITEFTGGQPVQLVPWLKDKIANHYPGTKLAISEWNYGGGADISGAIAAADALGIFGREGVELAAWAAFTDENPFVLGAFRAFRNYDGAGSGFGDTSVAATTTSLDLSAVYASVDSGDGHVVVVSINRSDAELDATLMLDTPATHATVYSLTSASPMPQPAPALTTEIQGTFVYTMPAYSIFVIAPG
jgi:hypothetical protein